jgi:hypothetical protein
MLNPATQSGNCQRSTSSPRNNFSFRLFFLDLLQYASINPGESHGKIFKKKKRKRKEKKYLMG